MMNQRIKVVSATSDQFIEDEKVAPSLVKEVKLKDPNTNTWSVKILYPMKNVETGGSTHRILVEEELIGDVNQAFERANELLKLNADVEVEYYEVKHIPHYKKGKFALKLRKDEDATPEGNTEESELSDDAGEDSPVKSKTTKTSKKLSTSAKAKPQKKVVNKKVKKVNSTKKVAKKVQKKAKVVKSAKPVKKVKKKVVKKKKITKNKK